MCKLYMALCRMDKGVKLWMFGIEYPGLYLDGLVFADGSPTVNLVHLKSSQDPKIVFRESIATFAPARLIGENGLLRLLRHADLPLDDNESYMVMALRKLRDARFISGEIWLRWTRRFAQPPIPTRISKEDLSVADLDAAGLSMTDLWILTHVVSYLSARGISTANVTAVGLPVGSYRPAISTLEYAGADVAIKWTPTATYLRALSTAATNIKPTYRSDLALSSSFSAIASLVDLGRIRSTMDISRADLSTISTTRLSTQDRSAAPPSSEDRLQAAAAACSSAAPLALPRPPAAPRPLPSSARPALTEPVVVGPVLANAAAMRGWEVFASGPGSSAVGFRRPPPSRNTQRTDDTAPAGSGDTLGRPMPKRARPTPPGAKRN